VKSARAPAPVSWPRSAFAIRGRGQYVVGIGGHAVSGDFTVNLCTRALACSQLLDDHNSGPSLMTKTVAVAIERPRGTLRLIVARAQPPSWLKIPRRRFDNGRLAPQREKCGVVGLMIRHDSPMALFDVAQASNDTKFGPASQTPSK